jgi:hypothetical protein
MYESPTDRPDSIDNVVECFGDIAELAGKFPIRSLVEDEHLPQEVKDDLEKLAQAAAVMVVEGPDILWAFAKVRGLADDVRAILDEQSAARQAVRADPNSLISMIEINMMGRKYREQS